MSVYRHLYKQGDRWMWIRRGLQVYVLHFYRQINKRFSLWERAFVFFALLQMCHINWERVRINREFEWNTCLTNWYFVSFPLIYCAQAQQRVLRCEWAEINGGFTYLTSSLMPRYGFCRIIFTRQTFDFTGRKLQSSQHPEHTRIIICVSIDSNGILWIWKRISAFMQAYCTS